MGPSASSRATVTRCPKGDTSGMISPDLSSIILMISDAIPWQARGNINFWCPNLIPVGPQLGGLLNYQAAAVMVAAWYSYCCAGKDLDGSRTRGCG